MRGWDCICDKSFELWAGQPLLPMHLLALYFGNGVFAFTAFSG